jgi:hypothetical protein
MATAAKFWVLLISTWKLANGTIANGPIAIVTKHYRSSITHLPPARDLSEASAETLAGSRAKAKAVVVHGLTPVLCSMMMCLCRPLPPIQPAAAAPAQQLPATGSMLALLIDDDDDMPAIAAAPVVQPAQPLGEGALSARC